ncbi:efflux RND transporter periplasmic adaptor subunit [Methylogaea oryzae]|uniref:efflux RND transporter periplasmic adaptor subunit n=1 Tax=Methylogaea oryzae TaxID=1295382 RepID=UPI003CCEF1C9
MKRDDNRARLKTLLPAAVLLTGAGLAVAMVSGRPAARPEPPSPPAPLAAVVRAVPHTLRLNVASQGVAAPRMEIDLVPEVAGKVLRLHPGLAAGGFFAEGEVLLAIDPRDYDYAIADARARLAEAQRQLALEEAQVEQARNEWRALGEGEPTPLALHLPQLAEARAKLLAAEADMAKAGLQRARCELKAPFSGRVRDKHIGLGQYVRAGDKLARIYATDLAEIRLPLAAEQLAFVDLPFGNGAGEGGAAVTLSADFAGAMRHWQGRIVRTEGALVQANGQLYAVAEVREPYAGQPPLLAGLFVQADIEGRRRDDVFVLPAAAVNASQQALIVDGEDRLRRRQLEVLRNEPGRVLVKGGLASGDRVVTGGIQVPVEGVKVRVEEVGEAR